MNSKRILIKDIYILLGIIFLGIFLREYYFFGIDFDGTNYTLHAKSIVEGIYDPTYLNGWNQGIRFGMLFPIAIMYKFFGVSDFSSFAFQFLISLLQIVLIYYLGKLWFNSQVGLFAAFLLAIYPIDVNNASILEADIFISFLTSLTVLLFYKANFDTKNYLLIFVGIIYAFAVFTKIFSGLLIFFYLLYSFFYINDKKKFIQNTLFVFIGIGIIMIPTMLYFYYTVHDPFYFYTVEKEANDFLLTKNILDVWYYPSYMLLLKNYADPPMYGIYFLIFFIAVIYYFKRRQENTNILLFWVIPILLLLMLIPSLPKMQRYLIIIEIPMILLISCFLFEVREILSVHLKNKVIVSFFIVLFFIVLIITNFVGYGGYKPFTGKIKDITPKQVDEIIYLILKDLPRKDIYVNHYKQLPFLSYYFKYTINGSIPFSYRGAANYSFYDLHFISNLSEIKDAYVIIDYRLIDSKEDVLQYYQQMNVSVEYLRYIPPPQNWHGIYGFTHENDIVVGGIWAVK